MIHIAARFLFGHTKTKSTKHHSLLILDDVSFCWIMKLNRTTLYTITKNAIKSLFLKNMRMQIREQKCFFIECNFWLVVHNVIKNVFFLYPQSQMFTCNNWYYLGIHFKKKIKWSQILVIALSPIKDSREQTSCYGMYSSYWKQPFVGLLKFTGCWFLK